MKIYTKKGDDGSTSLFGGRKVRKSSLRISACGSIDELNAQLSVVRALKTNSELDSIILKIQSQLFILASDVSTPIKVKTNRINQSNIQFLENAIDFVDAKLEPLQSFIYPGNQLISAQLHLARAVCRRAETVIDALSRKEDIGKLPLIYLNRLSDLLFVLARYSDKLSGVKDTPWQTYTE